jgi:hypothetical protein
MACTDFFCGCARRGSPRRIACTCFFRGCARRCSTRRMAGTCFFDGCAGTLHAPSSQRLLLTPPRPLPPHAAPFLPCRLLRTKDVSLLHSLPFPLALKPSLRVFGLFLPLVPPPSPRGLSSDSAPRPNQYRMRRESDVSHPLSHFHAQPCPQPQLTKHQPWPLALCTPISSICRIMAITDLRSSGCCCHRLRASPSRLSFLFLVPVCSGLGPAAPAPSPCCHSAQPSSSSVSGASSALLVARCWLRPHHISTNESNPRLSHFAVVSELMPG